MKNLMESIRSMYAPKTEATMMQDDGKVVHNCAKHVEHAEYGTGNCIAEEHADPDRYGNIAWYDIEFPHGIEKGVPVTELKILQAESHGHETKAKKKKMGEAADLSHQAKTTMKHIPNASPALKKAAKDIKPGIAGYKDRVDMLKAGGVKEGNDGNLANNAAPYDKVTHGDVIAGRLGKDEMGGKKKKVKEETEMIEFSLTEEEWDQLDELSKTTLANYIPMAARSARLKGQTGTDFENLAKKSRKPGMKDAAMELGQKYKQQARDRESMIGKAAQKLAKEEFEQVDETILHKEVEFDVTIAEKDYKAYFQAAMKGKDLATMSADEKKKHFNKLDAGYKAKNEDVFLEAMFDSHINDVIAAHKKAGNRVSDEKSAMSDGKMKHSYVITTPEGKRTRHIHHGSSKRLETMSPAKKSKQSQEQDLDDKD